ncbi:MAG TPA: xanthine dehydrogenase family protein subunit M [Dehalococcoidia bacterium]|nr:xanthine dehydrogenase family protein subunit M [Dehalococcoidia bacterium]
MIDRTYLEPTNLEQARSMLAANHGLRIVAGGTDLVVAARSGKAPLPERLIAIHRLKELAGIRTEAGRGLRIGALTTHADLEISEVVHDAWSALSDASALVGSPATRHVGTVGGNICNASPAMELGSPLLVFDATIELASIKGVRSVPFSSFVTGPGRTSAHSGELLIAVVVPPLAGRCGSAYMRLEYRLAMEIAIVGAAAMVRIDDLDRCIDAKVALTAVAPTCVRATEAEEILRGKALDSELLKRAAGAAAASARPIDDVRASADYRSAMVPVIVRRALTRAFDRAQQRRLS